MNSLWPILMPLVSSALGVVAYALKRSSVAVTGFWHQWYGHLLAVFGLCVVSSATDWIVSGQLTRVSAIAAGVTAISTFLALLMPSGKTPSENSAPTVPIQKVGAILLPFLFLSAFSACNAAFNQCVKASGIASMSTVENQVGQALSGATSASSVTQALEGIGVALLPSVGSDIFTLIECAILSWETKNPIPANASPSPSRYAAYAGAQAWMSLHFKVSP